VCITQGAAKVALLLFFNCILHTQFGCAPYKIGFFLYHIQVARFWMAHNRLGRHWLGDGLDLVFICGFGFFTLYDGMAPYYRPFIAAFALHPAFRLAFLPSL